MKMGMGLLAYMVRQAGRLGHAVEEFFLEHYIYKWFRESGRPSLRAIRNCLIFH